MFSKCIYFLLDDFILSLHIIYEIIGYEKYVEERYNVDCSPDADVILFYP